MNDFDVQSFWALAVIVGLLLFLIVGAAIVESRPFRNWLERIEALQAGRKAQADEYAARPFTFGRPVEYDSAGRVK